MKDIVNALVQIAKLVELFMNNQNKPEPEDSPDTGNQVKPGK